MRSLLAIPFAAMLIGGCASKPAEDAPLTAYETRQLQRSQYEQATAASALAFDAPAAMGHPGVNLNREPRLPGAFVGFESSTTVFSYVLFDDRQGYDEPSFGGVFGNNNNQFERRAISEEYKTSTR